MNTDTPDMDSFTLSMNGYDDTGHLLALDAFARRLERERNQARKKRDELIAFLEKSINDCHTQASKFKKSNWDFAEMTSRAMANAYQFVLDKLKEPKSEGV